VFPSANVTSAALGVRKNELDTVALHLQIQSSLHFAVFLNRIPRILANGSAADHIVVGKKVIVSSAVRTVMGCGLRLNKGRAR
jgi:hypothetical protein